MFSIIRSPVLEVYQFAHDASIAECWLIAQEPYLAIQDLGVCFENCIGPGPVFLITALFSDICIHKISLLLFLSFIGNS